ncbi:MAG: PAS domain S-box protein [Desulfomonilaceae bacterium]
MQDHEKTRNQLIDELNELRCKVAEFQTAQTTALDAENAPLSYQSLDENGYFLAVNRAWLDTLGYSREEVIGKWFGDFLAPGYQEHFKINFPRFKAAGEIHGVEFEMVRKDGSIISVAFEGQIARDQREGFKQTHCIFQDITQRKRTEEALQDSEERYRILFETAADGIFIIDAEGENKGRIVSANPAAVVRSGYTVDELLALRMSDLDTPESAKQFSRRFEQLLRGETLRDEVTHRRKDGTVLSLEICDRLFVQSGHQYVVAIHRDITERKVTEEALRHSQEMLLLTLEGANLGIWDWDLTTGKALWSERNQRMLGYEPNEFEPNIKNWKRLVHPEDWPKVSETLNLHLEAKLPTFEVEYRIKNKHGDWQWVQALGKIMEFDADKKPIRITGVAADITERKRLEQERLEMERKLLHSQKLESLVVMAGGIAHDFNNQLAIVLGNLEFALMERDINPEVSLSIKNAIEAAKRSAELSRKIQNYTGNALYRAAELDLKELLTKNLSQLKSCVSKHVTLNLEIDSTLPTIKGDADQIQRLVMNILDNASEAIGDGEGEVRLSAGAMDCDTEYLSRSRAVNHPAPGRFVFLEVSDTGDGMDAETQRQLFDPFFSTKFTGRGLGMAEALGIVKGHHGAIIVDSELGKGTTIRVLFPVSKEAQTSSDTNKEAVETESAEPLTINRRKTVLLVEDEAGVRDLAVRRLDILGYDTIVAGDGAEGVHIFRERLNEIDLVMLDFKMPKMNGVEAFEELIRIKPDVKVLLSSGYTEDVVMQSFPGQRPAGVLHKPYNMEALKGALERLLGTMKLM